MMRDMICIACPRGCRITVNTDTLEVTGNSCPRGAEFGAQEIISPERMLTTTVTINGAIHKKLPVVTSKSLPIAKLESCLKEIKSIEVNSPIKIGTVLISNIQGTGVDIVATRSM